MSCNWNFAVLFICLVGACFAASAEVAIPQNPEWEPIADEVYLQESVEHILTEYPLTAVAVFDGAVFVGHNKGVARVDGVDLVPEIGPTSPVVRLRAINNALWLLNGEGLWRRDNGDWSLIHDGSFVDVCGHLGQLIVASTEQVYRLDGEKMTPLLASPGGQPILGVQSYSETVYVSHQNAVGFVKGDRLEYNDVNDWGNLPLGSLIRDMTTISNRIVVATDRGLGVLRGASWHIVGGPEGLCYEDTTCVAKGFDHDYWVGTAKGAIRAIDGEYQYFGIGRWLPDGKVNAIAAGKRAVYIATDGGLSIITYLPYTLQKKAAWYKAQMKAWNMIRLGTVTGLRRNDDGTYTRFIGDNDIGFTCHYLDGLCFEYAATRDPAVRAEAVDIFKTVKWSEEITGIKGYPARAIYAVGEEAQKTEWGSAGRPAEYHETEDGKWVWKGDTSSDEIVAQYFTVSLFHDLVAEGVEKDAANEHLKRMTDHIIDNSWALMDVDGKPTVWAQWNPEFIYSPLHLDERGLNSLQALSFVAVAKALFPSGKYTEAEAQLVELGYVENLLRQKRTFPHYTRFDDRLAFLAYYPLLRYEADPAIRAAAMRSLQRSWEIKRIEKQTWFNFIYGALTGNECETAQAVDHLRLYPLDTFSYPYENSHRSDLRNPADYINYLESWRPLTPRDVGWQRWNRSFQQVDGGGGMNIQDPSGWLDAYWMGRYHGMILPPETTDPDLLTVAPFTIDAAPAPYNGPPRPEVY